MKVLVMEPERSEHGNEEQFESYALGTLPEGQASQLEQHLLTCEVCRGKLSKTEDYIAGVRLAGKRLLAAEESPQPLRESRRLAPFLAVAAALVMAVLGWQFSGKSGGPPVAVQLVTTRGAGGTAQAPAGRPLRLQPDLEGLSISASDRLEIASATGKIVWTAPLQSGTTVGGMQPGLYFVRVRRNSGELLREYGLEVKAGLQRTPITVRGS